MSTQPNLSMVPATTSLPAASLATRVAEQARRALCQEVHTWPKPGLVSHVDTGSHSDMDAATFNRSAAAIAPFLAELVEAGIRNEDMPALRKIGLRAEVAMLCATGGVNTHRGAIFGMGLLCAAAGLRAAGHVAAGLSLGDSVVLRWGHDILGGPRLSSSHGEVVGRRYGAGGARREAAMGFPTVYDIAMPAWVAASILAQGDDEAARVQVCFVLIAALEDTNLLHRGGSEGLRFAREQAASFLDRGGIGQDDWRARAEEIHHAFVDRNLSPGGAADLLAMTLFAADLDGAGLCD